MFTRIVKMTFKDEHIEDFSAFSKTIYSTIRNWQGCTHLDILQDLDNPQIFFTYSIWESKIDLHGYRHSDFFNETWSKAKLWFADKPEAWSVKKLFS